MRFLVIGNALCETVEAEDRKLRRQHTGGVAAIMARELALAGADTTILTTAPPGKPTEEIRAGLEQNGVNAIITPGNPPKTQRSGVLIKTINGEPRRFKGKWAPMGGLEEEIIELAPQFDWTLAALNLRPIDLIALRSARNLALNATTKNLVKRIGIPGNARICAMNAFELQALTNHAQGQDLHRMTGADIIMATMGPNGWKTKSRDGSELRSPAPPTPADTDFIGAGDAATAGLVYATAMKLDPVETVNRFITNLLERNADANLKG